MHTPLADDATAPDSDELAIDIPYYSSGDDEADDDGAASTPPAAAAATTDTADTNTDTTDDDEDPADAPPPPPPVLVCRSGLDPDYAVERWHWSALGVEAFRRRCAERRCPLIVTGLAPHLAPRGLGVERLRTLLPAEMAVPVRGHGTMSAGSFFERLDAGEKLYLADVPVAHHFPWLFAEVGVPAYFLHCFCHRTRRRLSVMHDTPALFVGGVGTTSALHVDQARARTRCHAVHNAAHAPAHTTPPQSATRPHHTTPRRPSDQPPHTHHADALQLLDVPRRGQQAVELLPPGRRAAPLAHLRRAGADRSLPAAGDARGRARHGRAAGARAARRL